MDKPQTASQNPQRMQVLLQLPIKMTRKGKQRMTGRTQEVSQILQRQMTLCASVAVDVRPELEVLGVTTLISRTRETTTIRRSPPQRILRKIRSQSLVEATQGEEAVQLVRNRSSRSKTKLSSLGLMASKSPIQIRRRQMTARTVKMENDLKLH